MVTGGSNLPEGQVLVGLFAYRLVSGHWQLQTRVSPIREEGTVTTGGSLGLMWSRGGTSGGRSGWTWHGLPCASMWGGSGRWGWLTSLTSRSRTNPPPPRPASRKAAPPKGDTEPPPPPPPRNPAYSHPVGAGGAGGGAGAEGGGARVG